MATFETINTMHRFTYTKYYSVSLPLFTYLWYFNLKTLETMLNYAHQSVSKSDFFRPHALSLKRSRWSKISTLFLEQVKQFCAASRSLAVIVTRWHGSTSVHNHLYCARENAANQNTGKPLYFDGVCEGMSQRLCWSSHFLCNGMK